MPGTHDFTFDVTSDDMKVDLAFSGLKVFQFCDGVKTEFISLFHSLENFIGGLSKYPWLPYIGSHTPPYMEKANVDFYKETMNVTLEERPIYDTDINYDLISSGDFLAITRLDGLD